MRLYLIPASGLNSNVVTTGPGLICTTLPRTLNSSNFDLIRAAMSFSSCSSNALRTLGSFSSSVGGSWYSGCSRGTAAVSRSWLSAGNGSLRWTGGRSSNVWIGISTGGSGSDTGASGAANS